MPRSLFVTALERDPVAPALVTREGRVISRGALRVRVERLAAQMAGPRGVIGVEGTVGEHAVVGLLAAWRAGHAVALMAPDPAVHADVCARFAPEALWRPQAGRWRLERPWVSPRSGEREVPHPDLALLLSTSGSTGHGRMVRLSAAAVAANAASIGAALGIGAADRAALVLPLHYSYGLSVLTTHLAAGASIWLHGGSVLDADFLPGLEAAGCSNLPGVPYTFDLLERIGFREAALPRLTAMTVAGGPLAPDRVRLYDRHLRARGGRLYVMYGQTEATARIAILPPERAADRPDRIGAAIPGGRLSLTDAAGRPVGQAGVPGELVYRGPNVMMGYAMTRADLARGAEVEALATGDVAERDADGLYRIVGRLKRMSKIAGVRISHDALEVALRSEGIAAVVVGDDAALGVAYEGDLPAAAVEARLAVLARLPGSRVRALPVSRLPRLTSGKPDLGTVRAMLDRAPPPPPEEGIAADFRATFGMRATAAESFVTLGGDSLRHVELAFALERRLGFLPEGWDTMSIRSLEALERDSTASRAPRIASDILLRALAILAVVLHHETLWPIPFGSAIMVVLIGYGLARFQRPALAQAGAAAFLTPLPTVLLPYFAIVAAYAVAWQQVPWASVFLVGNFGLADPASRTMLPFLYWFVEVYVQLLLGLSLLFLLPPARRAAIGAPFRFGLGLLAAAAIARVAGPSFWPLGMRDIFTLPWVLPLVAFGWCAAVAEGRQRLVVLALAALVMPALAVAGGNWVGAWVRYGAVFATLGIVMFVPTVPVPRRLVPAILIVAAAGYHIYLLHRFVPDLLLAPAPETVPHGVVAALAIGGGVLLGIVAHRMQRAAVQAWRMPPAPAAAAQSGASM